MDFQTNKQNLDDIGNRANILFYLEFETPDTIYSISEEQWQIFCIKPE